MIDTHQNCLMPVAMHHFVACIVQSESGAIMCSPLCRPRKNHLLRSVLQSHQKAHDGLVGSRNQKDAFQLAPFRQIFTNSIPSTMTIDRQMSMTYSEIKTFTVCVAAQPSNPSSLPPGPVPLLHRLLLGIVIFPLLGWMVIWLIPCVLNYNPHFELRSPVQGGSCEFRSGY